MLEGFVWFENSKKAINMSLVTDFWLDESDGKTRLLFRYSVSNENGARICDQDDIANFLQNVAKLDQLPSGLNVTQTVDTVQAGASLVGAKIGRIG